MNIYLTGGAADLVKSGRSSNTSFPFRNVTLVLKRLLRLLITFYFCYLSNIPISILLWSTNPY